MTRLCLSLSILFLLNTANAVVTLIYRLEVDTITANGVTLNQAYVNDTDPEKLWPNITVYSAVADWDDITSLSFTTGSPATFISELEALSSDSMFVGGWSEVSLAPVPTNTFFDWSQTRDFDETTDGGLSPILFFSTSPFGSLTSNDYVGLIASSALTVPSSTPGLVEVSFPGGANPDGWDTAVVGTLGSLSLQAVPEPSWITLAFGMIGVVVVWVRRRSQK